MHVAREACDLLQKFVNMLNYLLCSAGAVQVQCQFPKLRYNAGPLALQTQDECLVCITILIQLLIPPVHHLPDFLEAVL